MQLTGGSIDAEETARALLKKGVVDVSAVAEQTGLSVERVAELARTSAPEPQCLAKLVDARLRELGLSRLKASKLGYVSRSTLAGLADRVPSDGTLTNLDDLLSWEPGSARAALHGGEPAAREEHPGPRRPAYDPDAPDNYSKLTQEIEKRLVELNLSKVRFAEISGVGRSTLATLGKRGPEGKPYRPTPQTLERIDIHLMWEPGSAMAALKGGTPIRRGPTPRPHPALVPIAAMKERLRVLSARLLRQSEAVEQTRRDVMEMQKQVSLLYEDFQDPRSWTTPSGDQGIDQGQTIEPSATDAESGGE